MLPIFFVLPPSKVVKNASAEVHNYLQISAENGNSQRLWPQSWTAAAQHWRGLTITKLTQTPAILNRVKNLPMQKLQLSVTAADRQIELFFNCRSH
jgi:hypothetical protein